MYWPMLLWQQCLFSGDEQMLRVMAPRLTGFLQWLKGYEDQKTKLINPPDGSWDLGIRIPEYAGGNLPSGGHNIATARQYYENPRIAARIFSVLGRQPDFPARSAELRFGALEKISPRRNGVRRSNHMTSILELLNLQPRRFGPEKVAQCIKFPGKRNIPQVS